MPTLIYTLAFLNPPTFRPDSSLSHHGYFVDLYVRKSNAVAVSMYTKFGYSIYREVIGYYMGEENAYGAFNASS